MSLLDLSKDPLERESFTLNVIGDDQVDTLLYAIDYGLAHGRLFRRLRLKRLARAIAEERRNVEPNIALKGETAITAADALRRVAWLAVTTDGLQPIMKVKATDLLQQASGRYECRVECENCDEVVFVRMSGRIAFCPACGAPNEVTKRLQAQARAKQIWDGPNG